MRSAALTSRPSPSRSLSVAVRRGDELARLPAHHRAIHEAPGLACERVVPDDEAEGKLSAQSSDPYESRRGLDSFPVIAASIAYEGEIAGFVTMLEAASPRSAKSATSATRASSRAVPTFPNRSLARLPDAIVIGEARSSPSTLRAIEGASSRENMWQVGRHPARSSPSTTAEILPTVAKAPDEMIPAWAPIRTPRGALEHVPGGDGARMLAPLHLLRHAPLDERRECANGDDGANSGAAIPEDAKKVGLVARR